MQPASVVPFTAPATSTDPLGSRLLISDRPGERLEQLRFAARLLSPAFEAALRERVAQLAQFRHPCYARVRRVDRLDGGAGLAVVSDHPRGARLSDVLAVAERDGLDLDINAALCLVRQLVPAIAALHTASPGAAHGALSPDRIIVTPHARIVITEHVVGSAIEQLGLSRHDLWRDLRIIAPLSQDGPPRLDRRADIVQIGAVSLALVLGRPLRADELDTLPELLGSARETTVLGRRELVAAPLRRWLLRALHLDPRGSFQSTDDAQAGLEDVLSEEGGYIAAPIALESFLVRYQEHAAMPAPLAGPDIRPTAIAAHLVPQAAPVELIEQVASSSVRQGSPRTETGSVRGGGEPRLVMAPPPAHALASDAVPGTMPGVPPVSIGLPSRDSQSQAGLNPSERDQLKRFLGEIDSISPPSGDDSVPPETTKDDEPTTRSEALSASSVTLPTRKRLTRARVALIACAAVALGEAAYIWTPKPDTAPVSAEGRLSIDSRPAGATVMIDDRERGVTPLTLSLPAGPHVLALRTADSSRAVPVTIQAGVAHAQYVELAPIPTTGAIDVVVEPPGARVLLDGQPRGVAPVTIAEVAPGDHELAIEAGAGIVRQTVAVQAGLTTSVRPARTDAAPADRGWVTVDVPFEMQILEAGRVIGTTSTPRLPLPQGTHRLQIVSEALAFRTTATVEIVADKEIRVPVHLPTGSVAINATPWAEVWIDGQRAGETPIGSIALTVGPHELVFRHPDYPERHHAVSVTAGAPTRISVEMKP
jgi:hypothetical protein